MKLSSQNYPCIFVDEYNTSQMCPVCKETYTDLVEKCHLRIKYCSECEKYFHRDVMAAENIVNKGLSQIYDDKRIAAYLGERPKKSDSESQKKGKGKRKLDDSEEIITPGSNSQKGDEMECDDSEEDNSPGPSNSQGKRRWDESQSEEEATRSTKPRTHQPILKLKFDGQVCASLHLKY